MVGVNGEAFVKHIPDYMEWKGFMDLYLLLRNFNLDLTSALHLLRSGSHHIEHQFVKGNVFIHLGSIKVPFSEDFEPRSYSHQSTM
jgi:hypothetical protein